MNILKLLFAKVKKLIKYNFFIKKFKKVESFNFYFICNIFVFNSINFFINLFFYFLKNFVTIYLILSNFFFLQFFLIIDFILSFLNDGLIFVTELFLFYNKKIKYFCLFTISLLHKKSRTKIFNLKNELKRDYYIFITLIKKMPKLTSIKKIYIFEGKKIYFFGSLKYIFKNFITFFLNIELGFYKHFYYFYYFLDAFKLYFYNLSDLFFYATKMYSENTKNINATLRYNLNLIESVYSKNKNLMHTFIKNINILVLETTNYSGNFVKVTETDRVDASSLYNSELLFYDKFLYFLYCMITEVNVFGDSYKLVVENKVLPVGILYKMRFDVYFYLIYSVYFVKVSLKTNIIKFAIKDFFSNYDEGKVIKKENFGNGCGNFAIYLHYIFIDSYTYGYARHENIIKLLIIRGYFIYFFRTLFKSISLNTIDLYKNIKFLLKTCLIVTKKFFFMFVNFFFAGFQKKNFINSLLFFFFFFLSIKLVNLLIHFFVPLVILNYDFYLHVISKILGFMYNYEKHHARSFKVGKFGVGRRRKFFLRKYYFVDRGGTYFNNYFGRRIRRLYKRHRHVGAYRKLKIKYDFFGKKKARVWRSIIFIVKCYGRRFMGGKKLTHILILKWIL